MNVLMTLFVLALMAAGLFALIPILSVGLALLAVGTCFLLWLLPILIIAASDKTTGGEKAAWILATIFLAVLMYFFLIKGRRNQDKQRNELLAKLKPGQRIQTIGGVLGTVTQVNEKEVTVKVDETNNVKIKFTRGAVHRVLDEEKTETK